MTSSNKLYLNGEKYCNWYHILILVTAFYTICKGLDENGTRVSENWKEGNENFPFVKEQTQYKHSNDD